MKWILKVLTALLCLLTLSFGCAALAEEETMQLPAPVFTLPVGAGSVEIQTEWIEEDLWLFLPAFAQLDQLSVEGAELEWWDMEADEEGLWYVDVALDEEVYEVSVMRSQNLRTLFLFSDDPVNQGRAFVEDKSTKHENEAPASLALVSAQGEVQHAQHIEKLRGRGNTTWWFSEKKSYQFKLDAEIDLLDSHEAANRADTWLLMAEPADDTMLHNQICMDLGREIGLNVMESEFVDLYYDGCYRGTYRLSEKVEIEKGRVEALDYDRLLKKWNRKLGQHDLEALRVAEGENRFGNQFTYIDGIVDNNRAGSGAYLLEMEHADNTLSDRCWFRLSNDPEWMVYALKNPENASQSAVAYISERLEEARAVLRAGGVDPVSGRTAEEAFDLDAFARTLLLHELSRNSDGYSYSSSFFLLPEGGTQFQPGPLWDMDLSFQRSGESAYGFKESAGWLVDFYRVPAFLQIVQKVYCEEIYPLIDQVLLGDRSARYLRSLDQYVQLIKASKRMNDQLWEHEEDLRFLHGSCFEEDIRLLRIYLGQRSAWLYSVMDALNQSKENSVLLWMDAQFANPQNVRIYAAPWQDYPVQILSVQQMSDANENDYAVWQLEALVSAADGSSLETYEILLNGAAISAQRQENGSLLMRICYEDRSYRPTDYYGEDVGLIYNHEQYVKWYPEVEAYCGYDEQAVMDYFFDEGIYAGHVGNGFFDPKEAAELQPQVADYLFDDWSMYYWEFIAWGYEAGWMEKTSVRYVPAITDAL